MKNFVVLSYGRQTEYNRAIFAVLSFWAWYGGDRNEVQSIIFTDNPAYFRPYLQGLPVVYAPLTPGQLAEMRGEVNYVHRIKIAMLDQVFRAYPDRDILYTDTDAFFVQDPAPLLRRIGPGHSFMHKAEYTFAEGVREFETFGKAEFPRRFVELLESRPFAIDGRQVQFSRHDRSWNSGVMGLSRAVAHLMPDVYALNDAAYAYSGWFTCEQVAFSLVLQSATRLQDCEPYVFHYWGARQKVVVDGLLETLIDEAFRQTALPTLLQRVKQLTLKWQRQVELDRLQEGSLYAFSKRQLGAGVKYALKAIAKDPFSVHFIRDVLAAGRKSLA